LIEYFSNQTKPKPFPAEERAGWKAAGLDFSGTQATVFEHPTNPEQTVNFKDLVKGERGDSMPAILLAARTHQKGDLHVKGAVPEDFGKPSEIKRPTQSGAVHDTFQKAMFKGDFKDWKDAPDFAARAKAEPNKLAGQLYTALQETYAWMYRKMEPNLATALRNIEMPYYLDIAQNHHLLKKGQPDESLHEDWDPPASAFDTVAGKAKKNNDKVMGAKGWKEPY
jgi:hypothetical protein